MLSIGCSLDKRIQNTTKPVHDCEVTKLRVLIRDKSCINIHAYEHRFASSISDKFRYFIYNPISIYMCVWLCIFSSGYVFPYNSFMGMPETWEKTKGAKRTIPIISQTVLIIKRLVEKLLCLHKFRIPKYSCIFWNTGLDTVDLN
jgi:hypothetical protein